MGILSSLGNALKKKISIPKDEIVKMIDNNLTSIRTIAELVNSKNHDIGKRVLEVMNDLGSVEAKPLRDIYTMYLSKLGSNYRNVERHQFLGSITQIIPIVLADLEALDKNFELIFGEIKSSPVLTDDNLRVSHITAIGHLKNIDTLLSWYSFFFMLALDVDKLATHPQYRILFLREHVETVAGLVNDLNSRHGRTIAFLIEQMRTQGLDVLAVTNGHSFDSYSNDRDYSAISNGLLPTFGGFNTISPLLWISGKLYGYTQDMYERTKALREWVANRAAMFRAQMMGLDPESPEYKRLENIVAKLDAQIANHDHRIAQYESAGK